MKLLLFPFLFLSLLLSLLLTGCATYQGKVAPTRKLIQEKKFTEAADLLKTRAETPDGDQLVYLLDYGTALQISGDLKKSNQVFMKADKLADQLDYHSVSRQAGSLLMNQEMVQYKGDTFEKVFINAYLAMNFLALGDLDSALVEARRMNEKYQKLRSDEKKAFELNVFGKYLSALVWEADRKWDDAYIAYQEAYKIDPLLPTLPEDLIRISKKAQRPDEYNKWKKKFPQVVEDPKWYDKKYGELVILFQQGWGPRKQTSIHSYRMPELRTVGSRTQRLRLEFVKEPSNSALGDKKLFHTSALYNVEQAAMKTLADDQLALAAKRVAGVVAKEVVADQIRQKDELLGLVAWAAMHASDRADLRQWSLLPQTIQILRIPLLPGDYRFNLQGLDSSGSPTSDNRMDIEAKIKANQKNFVVFRSVD